MLMADTFKETVRPAANTGGARVLGMQMVGTDPSMELQAIVPDSWAGEPFCVLTGTSDGLYDSENTYRAPLDTTTPITVPHVTRSRHADKLEALDPEGYGIRVLRGACEEVSDDTPGALALWRLAAPSGVFEMFVNSFDADRLVAFPDDGQPVECDVIGADISVAFDRVCRLPYGVGQGPLLVRVVAIKDGRRGRTETVLLDLP